MILSYFRLLLMSQDSAHTLLPQGDLLETVPLGACLHPQRSWPSSHPRIHSMGHEDFFRMNKSGQTVELKSKCSKLGSLLTAILLSFVTPALLTWLWNCMRLCRLEGRASYVTFGTFGSQFPGPLISCMLSMPDRTAGPEGRQAQDAQLR